MNLGDSLYDSFLKGKYDPADFLMIQLKINKSRLSGFLVKEFSRKKIKVNVERLKSEHKCPIAFGKKTEWWLIDYPYFKDKEVETELKGRKIKVDYVLPICNKRLAIVAVKK